MRLKISLRYVVSISELQCQWPNQMNRNLHINYHWNVGILNLSSVPLLPDMSSSSQCSRANPLLQSPSNWVKYPARHWRTAGLGRNPLIPGRISQFMLRVLTGNHALSPHALSLQSGSLSLGEIKPVVY
jgi:hypothetical protein